MLLGEIKVADPAHQEGTTQQKLQAMYEYMQQLNKQIRFVLQNIDEDNLSPALTETIEGLKENNQSVTSTVTKGDLETLIRQTAEMIEMKASKVYTDPETGQQIDLWTQVIQTAADITSKADATYTDPNTGEVTHLWTQVFQSAEEISQKANATYTDPNTGKPMSLETQVIQTAEEITQKADKTYTDADGNEVDLATQVEQNAKSITQKANAEYTDPVTGKPMSLETQVIQTAASLSSKASNTYTDPATGKEIKLWTQLLQNAGEITAIVEGTTPVGAVQSSKVSITKDGVDIATGGTFTVESGNFTLDSKGSLTVSGAQVNGELLNEGRPVLTDADIYVGTVEPSTKRAGMIWIKPVADSEGNESAQTTHTGQYTSGSRQSLRSYPVTVALTGTPAQASADNYSYEFSVPIYFAGDVSSSSVSVTVGGKTFSATVSGNQYSHKTVKISGSHTDWLGNASTISIRISAGTDNITSERASGGYQISMISRAY